MDWINRDELPTLVRCGENAITPQMIILCADTSQLVVDIPVQPTIISPDNGPPVAVWQWYARLADRLIVIESAADAPFQQSAINIYTHFLQRQDTCGDWSVLIDLQPLPASIYVARPLFIESRAISPQFVVYRPDPQGWNTAVYKATSRADAEALVDFIMADRWNEACFIGEPEPAGKWAIAHKDEIILGTGSGLNWALKSACEMSQKNPSVMYRVVDISKTSSDVYRVYKGNVVKPAL